MNLEAATPEEILEWTFGRFERPALVSSFQAESSVLIHMASAIRPGLTVVTLDTGRLPQETFEVIDVFRRRYRVEIRIQSPDPVALEEMTAAHGANLFYGSPELRRLCCRVRKVEPLEAALRGHDAWITGVRREQTATRAGTPVFEVDVRHGGIGKVAPLARWTDRQVWDYIRDHGLPYHRLYDRGYRSIGCAPCSRPTRPGEDPRAGRWWWERGEAKECGLHWQALSSAQSAASEEDAAAEQVS